MNRSLRQRPWAARTQSQAPHELGGQPSVLGAAAVPSAVLASTSQTLTMSTCPCTSPPSSACPQTSSLTSPWPGSPVALNVPPYSPGRALPLALAPQVRTLGFPRMGEGTRSSDAGEGGAPASGPWVVAFSCLPGPRLGESSDVINPCDIYGEKLSQVPRDGVCVRRIQQGLLPTSWGT